MIRGVWASLVIVAVVSPGVGADLTKLERTLGAEPKYAGAPEYCLVVFGPEAARVWLVRDGDVLYADKNGNGDLTESGERIAGERTASSMAFYAGTVRVGAREHQNLVVRAAPLVSYSEELKAHPVAKAALAKDKEVCLMSVSAEIEVPGLALAKRLSIGARSDSSGPLLFGKSPGAAPVLHFGGPLQLRTEAARPKLYRNVVHDLMLTVGTPGVGPGTFAAIGAETALPAAAHVVVEAEFAAMKPDAEPVRQRYELKERC